MSLESSESFDHGTSQVREPAGQGRLNPLVTAPLGAAVGAAGGLAHLGWEAAVLGWSGLDLPTGEVGLSVLALYAVLGAVLGFLAGLPGRMGARHAVVCVCLAGAWLASARAGMALEESGSPAWVGVAILVPLMGVLGLVLTSWLRNGGLLLGLATAGFVVLSVGFPVNLHLIGSPTSGTALVIDGMILLVSAILGSLVAFLVGDEQRPLALPLFLAVGGALGWLAAWPVLERAPRTWPEATSDAGPPIVLVVIDTLRADHLGLYGYERPTSPVLDRAARRGLVYVDASATAPWTLPSFGTLLTGLHPWSHGAGVNDGERNLRTGLHPAATTLAEVLTEAGYLSAAIVTNPWVTRAFGLHRGFTVFDDAVGPWAEPSALHPLVVLGLDPLAWPAHRSAEQITDQALGFVQAQERSAWFLLVHYMDVHGPLRPSEEDLAAVGGGNSLIDHYDAAIHQVDRNLGRLLDGLPRNASVIITSDHGEQLAERRTLSHPVPPSTRHGHTVFQELLHVPLVVLGPSVGSRRVRRPVSLVDVPATIAHLARTTLPGDGLPLAEVAGGAAGERAVLSSSVHYGPEQRSARLGRYKLIVRTVGGETLFDLQLDPGEHRPVHGQTEDWREYSPRLRDQIPVVSSTSAGHRVPIGREVGDLLDRLGYRE